MKKIFGALSASNGAMLLAIASFASYIVGFARDLLVANFFGASGESDAFYAGFLLPDLVFTFLVLGFVSGALLPIFSETEKKNKKYAEKVFHSFFTLVFLCTAIFAGIAFFLAPFFIYTYFPHAQHPEHFIRITRILLLSPVLFSLSNTLGILLLSRKHFFSMAISPALYNVGIIIGIIFFGKTYGAEAGAWGAVFGAFLHLFSRAIDFPRTGISLKISFKFFPELREIFILGFPKTLGLVAFQLTIVFFTILAAKTETGGVAAWNFARNVQSLPVSLFGIAFATAALPFFSDAFTEKNTKKFATQLEKSILQILLFSLCAAIGMSLLGKEIISVLFEHGKFDNSAALLTSSILIPLALATPFEGMTHLFARAFLAHKRTLLPAVGRFLFLISASSLAFILLPYLGLVALGVAFVCAAAFESIFLFLSFHFLCQKIAIHFKKILSLLFISFSVGCVCVFSLFLFGDSHYLLLLIFAIIFSGIVFLGLISLLKIREIQELFFQK